MQQPIDQDLIKRYLKGECTMAERQQVRELMKSGEAQQWFEEVLHTGWSHEQEEADPLQLQTWQSKFQDRINTEERPRRSAKIMTYMKYAAIFSAFVIGIGFLWIRYEKLGSSPAIAMQETINPKGKLVKVILGDHTVITLNANSKIAYPAKFNGKTREVFLEGEAFFEVAHDQAHPFIVHTSKVKVCVLGTSFNVSAYQEDKVASVAVATGKVGVLANHGPKDAFVLLPGDQLNYNSRNASAEKFQVDQNDISAWQTGMLIAHNQTLFEISKRIERWYGVQIIFKRKDVEQLRINFKQRNDRLENVMRTLKFAGGIQYQIKGDQVTIW